MACARACDASLNPDASRSALSRRTLRRRRQRTEIRVHLVNMQLIIKLSIGVARARARERALVDNFHDTLYS